ncbi:MAG: hypothetical protein ACLSVD_05190 [Eggerthellaceae bacterium]
MTMSRNERGLSAAFLGLAPQPPWPPEPQGWPCSPQASSDAAQRIGRQRRIRLTAAGDRLLDRSSPIADSDIKRPSKPTSSSWKPDSPASARLAQPWKAARRTSSSWRRPPRAVPLEPGGLHRRQIQRTWASTSTRTPQSARS